MALTKKYSDVYDGVKHKTPMQKMLEAQAAREEAIKAKQKQTTTQTRATKKKEVEDE
jgi:hypothetical protein